MKVIAIYPGRFQPFCKHHNESYKWLESKFGKENTYVVTSDVTDGDKSPLSFLDKSKVISKYGIKNIAKVSAPYKPVELLQKFDPATTALVVMVGEKDMINNPRLNTENLNSYYKKYEDNMQLEGYSKRGYVIIAPHSKIKTEGIQELSGTEVRNIVRSNLTMPIKFKRLQEAFGWYDYGIFKAIIEKMSVVKKKSDKKVITEGGAGKHISHVHELDNVKSGEDLIRMYDEIIENLKSKPASLKIDGVNVAVKIISDKNNVKQFAIDRGTKLELDKEGVTIDKLQERFPQNPQMVKIGNQVLTILNSALNACRPALEQIGMLNDSTILLNIEYVNSQTNIVEYKSKFLYIHGILKVDNNRTISKYSGKETYLEQFVNLLEPFAKKAGFKVLKEISVSIPPKAEIDMLIPLNKDFAVKYKGKKYKGTIKNGLSHIKNIDKNKTVTFKGGKSYNILSSKLVETFVNKAQNLQKFVRSDEDFKDVVTGMIFTYANMIISQYVLDNCVTSGGQKIRGNEGIVVKGITDTDPDVKLTGKFVLSLGKGKIKR